MALHQTSKPDRTWIIRAPSSRDDDALQARFTRNYEVAAALGRIRKINLARRFRASRTVEVDSVRVSRIWLALRLTASVDPLDLYRLFHGLNLLRLSRSGHVPVNVSARSSIVITALGFHRVKRTFSKPLPAGVS